MLYARCRWYRWVVSHGWQDREEVPILPRVLASQAPSRRARHSENALVTKCSRPCDCAKPGADAPCRLHNGEAERRVSARPSVPKMIVTGVDGDAAREDRRHQSNDPKKDDFKLARRSELPRVRR
jgi:hypothetical protein